MNWYKKIWAPKSLVIVFLQFEGAKHSISAIKFGKKVDPSNMDSPQTFESVEEVVDHFGKSKPYHLHVSGTGVLSRKVSNTPDYLDNLIVSGNAEEFNFTTYSDDYNIVASFYRKELIESYVDLIKTLKIHLLGISSGDVPFLNLLVEDESINLDYFISKSNGNINVFARNESPTKRTLFRHNYFSKEQLLALAIFSNSLEPDVKYNSSLDAVYIKAKDDYSQYSQFKFYGISVVTVLFIAVVSNYFYQNHLNNSVAQLELDLSISNENLSLLERLEQEKIRKIQLVQNAGVNTSRFMSFYLDEIGRTTPKMISLTDLELYPIISKLKNKQRVEVDQNKIIIYGVTSDNEILDNWIEKLDEFEWVRSVELLNYLKNEEGKADFKFVIALNE